MSNQSIPPSEWLTASEAADYLRVRVRTLLLWARHGKVKAYALSGPKRRVWRFRQQDFGRDSDGLCRATIPIAIRVPCGKDGEMKRAARFKTGSVVFDKRRKTWNFLWWKDGQRQSRRIGTLEQVSDQGCRADSGSVVPPRGRKASSE